MFLKLGLTSFGGPIAHLGYFRQTFVVQLRWLSEQRYADLVALCQFLPGPASSQVGMGVGLLRAGVPGALAAWVGFTLPSALLMILFGLGITGWGQHVPDGTLHGLKLVAVAVVAQAVWGMGKQSCRDSITATFAIATACACLIWPGAIAQIGGIVLAGAAGLLLFPATRPAREPALPPSVDRRWAALLLLLFFALLLGLPMAARAWPGHGLDLFDAFYRAGALVFGGGHVVLPLLQSAVVPPGWIGDSGFLAGYGAAQAMPGPLFTFAGYLGAAMSLPPNGWTGGLLCLAAIFVPSFLLLVGAMPFWDRLRGHARAQSALLGVNAAVVGILLAALYDPIWVSTVRTAPDFVLVLVALAMLMFWRLPPWIVVVAGATVGTLADRIG
ncbi:MAG: chromate efflux transporter [Burkholderiales bacterium]|nr:chromate efflux transporter [Burkholderiales bacterium]